MNKLISRNPIQRFKQGRKIHFAKPGDKMLYHGNEQVTEEVLNGQTIYRRSDGSYIYPSNKFLSPADYSFMTQGKLNPETTSAKNQREGYFNNQKKKLASTSTPPNKKGDVSTQFNTLGNDQTKRLIDAMANPVKTNKINNKVLNWQNKLKDFYAPGTFKADGLWGKNTEAAYQKYLQLSTIPSLTEKEAVEIKSPKMPMTPSVYSLMNPVEKDLKASLSAPTTPQTYNRTQVRQFLRNKGVNPYNFTGDQRRAVRMILNGQGTDEDKALVQGMGIFKKGGQLPSRNPITRFRNRKSN